MTAETRPIRTRKIPAWNNGASSSDRNTSAVASGDSPWPMNAADRALANPITSCRIDRLAFATTKAMTSRGAISLRVCRVCRVSCDMTTAPPATTNNTKTALAIPAFIDQIEATRPDRVTSGVASSVCPNRSRIGFHAAITRPRNQLSIAYLICPGMSNRPGFFSTPLIPGSSVAAGSGAGTVGSPGSTTTGPDGTAGAVGAGVGMVGPMNGGLLVGNPVGVAGGPDGGKGNTGGVVGGGGEVGNTLGPSLGPGLGAVAGRCVATGLNRTGPAAPDRSDRPWPAASTRTARTPTPATANPTTGGRRRRRGGRVARGVVISGDDLLQDTDQQRRQSGQGITERGVFERVLRPADTARVAVGGQVPDTADRQIQRGHRGQQTDDQRTEPADHLLQRRRRRHHRPRIGPREAGAGHHPLQREQHHDDTDPDPGPGRRVARGLPTGQHGDRDSARAAG